jgi:hypothetical protein
MRQATHSTQVFSIFGGGYVPEQRTDERFGNLAPTESAEAVTAFFNEVMQSLRSALSLR